MTMKEQAGIRSGSSAQNEKPRILPRGAYPRERAAEAALDGLQVRLDRGPDAVFTAAAPDGSSERRAGADRGGLNE